MDAFLLAAGPVASSDPRSGVGRQTISSRPFHEEKSGMVQLGK